MSQQEKTILETEWSHFVDVESLEGERSQLSVSSDDDARKRLCQRLGLVSIEALEANVVIEHPTGASSYHVSGKIAADITQSCVVTLEPVLSHIEEEFEAWYADPEAAIPLAKARHERLSEKGHGEVPMVEEHEDPEALIDGRIDLGELVTQYLSLAIDPYPHAEGVEFEQGDDQAGAGDPARPNPFAALKDWKDKLGDGEG